MSENSLRERKRERELMGVKGGENDKERGKERKK